MAALPIPRHIGAVFSLSFYFISFFFCARARRQEHDMIGSIDYL